MSRFYGSLYIKSISENNWQRYTTDKATHRDKPTKNVIQQWSHITKVIFILSICN